MADTKLVICEKCWGTGHVHGGEENSTWSKTCEDCRGIGFVRVPMTNADHIRSMTDEELANLLCTADWCETCDQMREEGTCKAMELDGPLNKHCVSAALRWLRQPYKEAPNDPT